MASDTNVLGSPKVALVYHYPPVLKKESSSAAAAEVVDAA
jgi:hypothetical protein